MNTPDQIQNFNPAEREGIQDVGWFTPRDAARNVTHLYLKPLMRTVRRIFDEAERAPRETAPRDIAPRDTAPRDTAPRDAVSPPAGTPPE